jgi:Flp pilus assembly protein TadD
MIKGKKQKLDEARGPGAGGPIRRGRPKIRQLLSGLGLSRTAGKYGMATLVVLALWGALSLGVFGCSTLLSLFGWQRAGSGNFAANVGLSPEEITRLSRNVHYYKLMGQPELGLRELELVHQQNPDNLKIINILAQNYEELGKYEAAQQLYEEALTRHGSHPVLANNLCFSYYLQGRWQEAETCFRKALARDPQNMAARNNLGLLYCRLGRQEAARRLWLEVESEAAADLKVSQALAALGRSGDAVYAQKPAAAPPVAQVTTAPRPEPVVASSPAPAQPAKVKAPAPPAISQASARLAKKLAAAPSPVAAKPREQAQKPAAVPEKAAAVRPVRPEPTAYAQKPAAAPPAAQVTAAPRPEPVVASVSAPAPAKVKAPASPVAPKESAGQVVQKPATPSPVAVKPRKEAQKPAAVPEKAVAVKSNAVAPEPAAAANPPTHPIYLTCAELVGTAIEVRTGTWTRNLAHRTRTRLNLEGFTVAEIGNHIDFGATKTIIYYRPGVKRVARVVSRTFFPKAKLTQSQKLKKGVDIKILLGADLKKQPQVMASLTGEGQ